MDVKDHLDLCRQIAACMRVPLTLSDTTTHHEASAVIRACVYIVSFTVEYDNNLLIVTKFETVNGSNTHTVVFSEEEVANSLALNYSCKTYKLIDGANGHATNEKFVNEDRCKPRTG